MHTQIHIEVKQLICGIRAFCESSNSKLECTPYHLLLDMLITKVYYNMIKLIFFPPASETSCSFNNAKAMQFLACISKESESQWAWARARENLFYLYFDYDLFVRLAWISCSYSWMYCDYCWHSHARTHIGYILYSYYGLNTCKRQYYEQQHPFAGMNIFANHKLDSASRLEAFSYGCRLTQTIWKLLPLISLCGVFRASYHLILHEFNIVSRLQFTYIFHFSC